MEKKVFVFVLCLWIVRNLDKRVQESFPLKQAIFMGPCDEVKMERGSMLDHPPLIIIPYIV